MDAKNTFDTPVIARLHRLEYLAGLALASGLFIAHWHEIRWLPAIGLFLYIDLIGYIPGAIAFYQRLGFETIGHRPFTVGTVVYDDFVMSLSL